MNESVTGQEPIKELTPDEQQHKEFLNEIARQCHDIGAMQVNVRNINAEIEGRHVKIGNLSVDANKLYKKIHAAKAEEQAAKDKAKKDAAEILTPKLELVNQDQEACIGGTDVLQ